MKLLLRNSALMLLAATLGFFSSCKKDDKTDVQAGFTYKVSTTDWKTVEFTSTSVDAKTLSWNFGDGSALATDANPTHTFAGAGTYTVSLTAINGKDQDITSQTITLADPQQQLTSIAGSDTKSWKLLRVVSSGRWPLIVGPIAADGNKNEVWWAQGRDNDEIARRPCIMNDEWIFGRDGSFTYDSNGDFWAEGGVFDASVDNECKETTAANLIGPGGTDNSAFGDGTHAYSLTATQVTLTGNGAWIGLPKIGTDTEVNAPQASTTLDILKLVDGTVDTMILESSWKFANNTSGNDDAYWRIILVHYDNAGDEPAIPSPKPIAGFNTTVNLLTVTFNNTSQDATSYAWDFGDGGTSTEANPTHTYGSSGEYNITMTATNAAGSSQATLTLTVTDGAPMTADKLVGGAWKVRNAANSVVVGPGLGDGSWYQVSADALGGALTGADDWSCMPDDEFIFTAAGADPADGSMQYKTNGSARNDSYFGTPNGCWTDAEIAASPGSVFGSGTHTYEFIPASASPSGRPIIRLTNGGSQVAFIGFYKGYYGGENAPVGGVNPAPNGGNATTQYEVMSYLIQGGKEVMTVSVDISQAHDGSAAWTMVMTR